MRIGRDLLLRSTVSVSVCLHRSIQQANSPNANTRRLPVWCSDACWQKALQRGCGTHPPIYSVCLALEAPRNKLMVTKSIPICHSKSACDSLRSERVYILGTKILHRGWGCTLMYYIFKYIVVFLRNPIFDSLLLFQEC
jgi:hypothetical protein